MRRGPFFGVCRSLSLFLGFFILSGVDCNRSPVGFDIIGDVSGQVVIEVFPDRVDSYGKFVPLGSAPYLLMGRDGEYESRILVKFPWKDSALDSVSSVQLVLFPRDFSPMRFLCYPCSSSWSSSGVSWRMSDSFNQWMSPGGDYYQNLLLAQGRVERDSTVLEFNRDLIPILVRNTYGLILIPDDTGFVSLYSLDNTNTSPRVVFNYLNGKRRTYLAVEDAHIVDSTHLKSYPGELLVGSSVALRTYIHFPLDSVPKSATITKAELELRVQTVYAREETLRVGAHRVVTSYNGRYSGFTSTPCGTVRFLPNDTIIRLEVTGLVQDWVSRGDSIPNYGLILTSEPEYLKPFRIKIFGFGTRRPRLKVGYLLPPEDRFIR